MDPPAECQRSRAEPEPVQACRRSLVAWHRQIMTTKINELRKAAAAVAATETEFELDYSS